VRRGAIHEAHRRSRSHAITDMRMQSDDDARSRDAASINIDIDDIR
jgi:hypothetical protein